MSPTALMDVAHIPTPKVFRSLQATRALAAMLVVLYHCADIFKNPKYWNVPEGAKILDFGKSGVEVFFVLSGIVILQAHRKDINLPARLMNYAWKRFRRIYPIYWIVLALIIPVYILRPSFGAGVELDPAVLISSFLLIHIVRPETILAVSWTLFHEVMFYAFFGVVILSRTVGTVLLGLWMCTSAIAIFATPASPILQEFVSPLHLLFGLGLLVGTLAAATSLRRPGMIALIGLAGFISVCIGDAWGIPLLSGPNNPPGNLAFGVFAALVLWGVMDMERKGRCHIPKLLLLLGDASYSIYLVHFIALSVFARLLYSLSLKYSLPQTIPFVLLAVLGTTSGLLVYLFVERRLLNLHGRLAKPAAIVPVVQKLRQVDKSAQHAGPAA